MNRDLSQQYYARMFVLLLVAGLCSLIIVLRLFNLQVIKHSDFVSAANEGQGRQGQTLLEARRGEILVKDHNSGDTHRLATNTTVFRLIADPYLVQDANKLTEELVPIVFDLEYEREKETERVKDLQTELRRKGYIETVKVPIGKEEKDDDEETEEDAPEEENSGEELEEGEFVEEEKITLPEEFEEDLLRERTDDELYADYKEEFYEKLIKKQRDSILLYEDLSDVQIESLSSLNFPSFEVIETNLYAYPPNVANADRESFFVAPIIGMEPEYLSSKLEGNNRYTVLQNKVSIEDAAEIEDLTSLDPTNYFAINLEEQYYRYYPEEILASQVLGFVNSNGEGVYGIEASYNDILKGEDGIFQAQKDGSGNQITVGDSVIRPAKDGDDIVLTIDRAIQYEVEKILQRWVEWTRANSAQVVVQDPKTGFILAMAQYPTFNPNTFGKALELEEIVLSPEDKGAIQEVEKNGEKLYYLVLNEETDEKYQLFPQEDKDGNTYYLKYVNTYGADVYRNKSVQDVYEPGSVFKAIAMSIGVEAKEVTPNTTYNDVGPIEVDTYTIRNSTDEYFGITDMKTVLAKSLNTGMAFVSRKLGPVLFYDYLTDYGFGEKTNIEFLGEQPGTLKPWETWADSELITHSYGQGISANMVQVVTAISAIANKGVLMEPHIVQEVIKKDGTVDATEPHAVRRVVSEQTASTMTAMMVNVVEEGVAPQSKLSDWYVAGKSGTSQTYKYGQPLRGAGTTVTSFAGFGPIDDPRFTVLVKMDKPKSSEWGAETAAPLFAEVMDFLYRYYNISPDKN